MRQTLSPRIPDHDAARHASSRALPQGEIYESLLAATTASEQRAIETAAKTATALDSVAAWIEQAQSRFAEVGQSSAVADALKRIESRLDARPLPGREVAPQADGLQDALRGFEHRIAGLTERLSGTPRPIGRRFVKPDQDMTSAVAEIRQRQAELDQPAFGSQSARPAMPALDRNHASILLSLRGDIAKLAGQLDSVRAPDQAAIDHLAAEFEQLRGSVGTLATRDDLTQIEQSIAELSGHIEETRAVGGGIAQVNAKLDVVQSAMKRLSELQASPDTGRLDRHVRVLSDKLDAVAAGGVDPALHNAMTAQLKDLRSMVAGLAAPADIASLGRTMGDLRNEIASLAARQVDPSEIASLRVSVDDVRRTLSSGGAGPGYVSARDDIADGMRPVEALLHALVEKLDGVQRQVAQRSAADPDALDALERQITDLAARFTDNSGRDPGISHLESAMSGLMSEIATWREDAMEAAERAARTAVSEAMTGGRTASTASPSLEREVGDLKQRWDASEKRTETSLAAINSTLENVAARITSLSLEGAAAQRQAKPAQAPLEAERPIIRASDALRHEPSREALLAEAERPVPAPAADEILLEPGAARPRASSRANVELGSDGADIKSSFIAAARRAAQAAASDAASPKARGATQRPAEAAEANEPSGIAKRLRAMIDKHRRPLLLSAAALVLALGALQMLGRGTVPSLAPTTAPERTTASTQRPVANDRTANLDPLTTQSITPRTEARTQSAPAAPNLSILPPAAPSAMAAPPIPAPAASLPAATPAPVATADAKPAPAPAEAALPAGLKQAALAGNPVAAYEYASRAADGRGLAKDPQLAARMFEKAAEKGLAPAQYRLGNLYEKGIGVPRDIEQAKNWYRRAAETGNARAMHNLAVLLAEGGGSKPDYTAAVTWFARAAELGVRDSQFNLAVLYARGLGTPQDLQKSYLWFAVTAASGDADSAKKRDDVGARLSAADLARARANAERWKPTPASPAANEVVVPASGWAELPTTTAAASPKKLAREGRV